MMLWVVHLALFYFAASSDVNQGCPQVQFQGRRDEKSGIVQHTMKYATVPSRWAPANATTFSPHEVYPNLGASHDHRCSQLVCVACGWKPQKMNLLKPETKVEGEEDCLHLSVFRPMAQQETSSPVAFHIHHGQLLYGFRTEHGEVRNVVHKGVVVSNANFRLATLGFLAHPDLEQVNSGQHDLMLALQWVQKYICSVGGDPSRVTITGSSSAGAQAVMLIASSLTKGLFRQAWINSATMIGMPGFFSNDVNSLFEKTILSTMKGVGCGNLQCMQEFPVKRMMLALLAVKSPLVLLQYGDGVENAMTPLAYDGMVVPNMHQGTCDRSMSQNHVPIVVGQSKHELDNLKFQFPLYDIVKSFVSERVAKNSVSDPQTLSCMQRKVMNFQGVQETVEDLFFNLGSYHIGSSPGSNSRWHFLITAPASITHRAWHTAAELLTWSPNHREDTSQYDHLTKKFVLGNAQPELLRYGHDNFVHYVKHGTPEDKSWSPTKRTSPSLVGGLPSKVWSQTPSISQLQAEHHHSNFTINALHRLTCLEDVASWVPPGGKESCATQESAIEPLQHKLNAMKWSDLLFNVELAKAFGDKALQPETWAN